MSDAASVLRLFGTPRVVAGGKPLALGRRARGVLVYLSLSRDRAASRERLADLFWGDRAEAQARASLRQCLLEIRAALPAGHRDPFVADRESVALAPAILPTDLDVLLAAADGPASGLVAALTALGDDVFLSGLDFGGAFDDWAATTRAGVERRLALAVHAAIAATTAAADWPCVIALADAWARRDPLDEAAAAAAIAGDVRRGAATSARKRFDAFAALLERELGTTPGAAVRAALAVAPAAAGPPTVPVAAAPTAAAPERLLAVLAFDNLSGDPQMAYFSDGVSEEILQSVARLPGLPVAGRASSFQFRDGQKACSNVTAVLGASHILDGAVRRSGNQVRISASLTECASDTVMWSDRFDRDLADIFAVQDDIAGAVARALALLFTGPEPAARIDPVAFDLFLRARVIAAQPVDVERCIALLEAAVARAPGYAAAWASLAAARSVAWRWRDGERAPVVAAAARALELDPASGLTHVVLGDLEPQADFAARATLLDRALALAPTDVEVLKHAADFAADTGRVATALELIARAYRIDPFNRSIANQHAHLMIDAGLTDAGFAAYDAARARWPDFGWNTASPLLTAAFRGEWDRAEPLIAHLTAHGGDGASEALTTVAILRDAGGSSAARLLAGAERRLAATGRIDLGVVGLLDRLGRGDAAFDLVARASFDHLHASDGAPADRRFLTGTLFGAGLAGLRRDPRFVLLCERLGLGGFWRASGRWPDCADAGLPYDFRARVAGEGA